MDDSQIAQAFQPLYDDAQGVEQKPLLAHYTSLGTLEKILKTDEVWFSNPLFMNDFEEVRFGVLRGVELIHQSHKLFIDACGSDRRALTFETEFKGSESLVLVSLSVETISEPTTLTP